MLCFASAAAAFWPFKVDAMICFAPWLPSLAVWPSEDDPRIRILLPHMMICVVLRIPPHRRHPPRPRIPGPRTSSSDTDIIARSDYSRGSTDPATSTASAPPADSWTAVPRTSSSDTSFPSRCFPWRRRCFGLPNLMLCFASTCTVL